MTAYLYRYFVILEPPVVAFVILEPAPVAFVILEPPVFFIITILAACAISLPEYSPIVTNAVNSIAAVMINMYCLYIKKSIARKYIWMILKKTTKDYCSV